MIATTIINSNPYRKGKAVDLEDLMPIKKREISEKQAQIMFEANLKISGIKK